MGAQRPRCTTLALFWYGIAAPLLALCVGCGDSARGDGGSAGSTSASGAGFAAAGASSSSGGNVAAAGANSSGGRSASGGRPAGGSGGAPDSSLGGAMTANGGAAGSASSSAGFGGVIANGGVSSGGVSSGGVANGGVANGGVASVGSTIVPDPSWACGKPEGIVDPTQGELVFQTTLDVGAVRDVGLTQYGKRRATDIKAGTISSTQLNATVLTGGLDFELTLSDGSIELEQVAMLKANDGALIYMRSCGVAPAGASIVRLVPDFEAANGSSVAWLNTGNFVGTRSLDATGKKLELAVYDVSKVTAVGPEIQLKAPTDAPSQPWDCAKASGTKGAQVFTESVTLGGSLSIASKRGTRNVIPITGGTITGKLTGSIVSAGADYQLAGTTTTLDARYVLATNDGEFVVVRNCGVFGALVPQFETRAAGAYAFLNTGKFLSSDPGSAAGGVSITFYEAN